MTTTRTYTCLCGATFDNWSLYGGHKQCCSTFLIDKYGSLEVYFEKKNRNHISKNEEKKAQMRAAREAVKQEKLQQWIDEKHICEKCGKNNDRILWFWQILFTELCKW